MPAAVRADSSIRATLRNNGIPATGFRGLLDLPKHEQKAGLLCYVQQVYDTAMSKQGLGKAGAFDNPDCHSAGKMIEVAGKILELDESKPGDGEGGDGDSRAVDLAKAAARLEAERKSAA